MHLLAGVAQQPGQVAHAGRVPDAGHDVAELEGPVLAFPSQGGVAPPHQGLRPLGVERQPHRPEGGPGGGGQLPGPHHVAGAAPGDQHAGVVGPAVGAPDGRADAVVHAMGGLEVVLGLVESPQQRRQLSEEAGAGAPRPMLAGHDLAPGVVQEPVVELRDRRRVVEQPARLGQRRRVQSRTASVRPYP